MYWTRFPNRSDLEDGHVFAHGTTRMNLSASDLETFVDPADAALVFGFRGLSPEDTYDTSFPVWMATLRRQSGEDAIVESLQRVFTQLADDGSLVKLLADTCEQARALGYRKLRFVPALNNEPLFIHALRRVVHELDRPLELQPTTGMAAIALS